jgi:methyl-accepting chemotaxis protein
MNFDLAINKHAAWRMKFRTAMNMKEKMDAVTIGKDNCCELGKWLYGPGKAEFGRLPSFNACLDAHKAFHAEAGKVAVLINECKYAEAEMLLGPGSAYAQISSHIGGVLIKLKHEQAKAA